MSHLPERQEKVCLNCGTQLSDRFCPHCGQENVEPRESVWHLLVHFFNDFTHFDGKFFSTLKLLLTKPGLLSEEYMNGKRVRSLNPIRMYIFTSAFFFFIYFSTTDTELKPTYTAQGNKSTFTLMGDTEGQQELTDSTARRLFVEEEGPKSVKEYDSLQQTLTPAKRDNRIKRYINRRLVATEEYLYQNPLQAIVEIRDNFLHSFPKMLFISLPFFALFLYLFNLRRRQTYFYVSHAIFSVHLYCAVFVLLLAVVMLSNILPAPLQALLMLLFIVVSQIYLFYAMKRFYKIKGWELFFQFVGINIMSTILVGGLTVVFFFNSVLALAAKH